MDKLYSQLNHKKFILLTIFLSFLGDISVCRYLWVKLQNQVLYSNVYEIFISIAGQMPQAQGLEFPSSFKNEMFQLLMQTMLLGFALVIFFHIIIYLLHFKEKKIVKPYIKTTCFLGALACFSFGFNDFFKGPIETYMLLQGLFYTYIFLGFGYFREEAKS
jgi:hypothetical protein